MLKEFPRRVRSNRVPTLLSFWRVFLLATIPTVLPISLLGSFLVSLSARGKRLMACFESILNRSFSLMLPVLISQCTMKMSAGLSVVLSGSNRRGSAIAVSPAFRITSRRSSWIFSIPFDIRQRRKCLPSPIWALHLHVWCWILKPITIGSWRRSLSIVFHHSSFENRVWGRDGVACRGIFAILFNLPLMRACCCGVLSVFRYCSVCSISLMRESRHLIFRSPQSQRSPMMDGYMPGFS